MKDEQVGRTYLQGEGRDALVIHARIHAVIQDLVVAKKLDIDDVEMQDAQAMAIRILGRLPFAISLGPKDVCSHIAVFIALKTECVYSPMSHRQLVRMTGLKWKDLQAREAKMLCDVEWKLYEGSQEMAKGRADVVSIYNKYLVQLLTALKNVDAKSRESVRAVLRQVGIKAIDHESRQYILLPMEDMESFVDADVDLLDTTRNPDVDVVLLPGGVRLSVLVQGVVGGSEVARPFVALLRVLAATYRVDDESLAIQTLRAISAIQSGASDASAQVAAVFDDDVQACLKTLETVLANTSSSDNVPPPAHAGSDGDLESRGSAFMDALEGSSIALIAKEIADELVDSDMLKDIGSDPSKIDFASLLDPSSKLGGIAKLVSSKLQDQLGSGKLDQSKLMGEVMSMFGNLSGGGMGDMTGMGTDKNANPLLSQVMNMAQQMGANLGAGGGPKMPPQPIPGGERGTNARARLQEKLTRRTTSS